MADMVEDAAPCPGCGEPNEPERDILGYHCLACYRRGWRPPGQPTAEDVRAAIDRLFAQGDGS